MTDTKSPSSSTIVVGAGVSGLAAAVRLAEAGYPVTVLEASKRVGGRVRTGDVDGIPVELGAEFIHGRPPELLRLLDELGLHATEREGTMLHYAPDGRICTEDGSVVLPGAPDVPTAAPPAAAPAAGDPFSVMEQVQSWVAGHPGIDMSFAEWAEYQGLDSETALTATGYVEGFNAADSGEISVVSLAKQQDAEDAASGSTALHLDGGYALLPERLAERLQRAGGVLRLRSQVVQVRWQPGAVTLVLADGTEFHADAAILTLPLGVLQANAVHFVPAPADILAQASRLRMGHVCRLSLVFRRRWWAELQPGNDLLDRMSFLLGTRRRGSASTPAFDVFWTGYPSTDPVITAWAGGTAAQAFQSPNVHSMAHLACAELARIFGLTQSDVLDELVAHRYHDWTRDPLSLGAYSWVAVGGVDSSAKMAEPVSDTLYFAGEHTDLTSNWGTIHGALGSGLRAAAQLLQRHSTG